MADSKMTAHAVIAHCLLMGQGAYETPEAFADTVLKRLDHEGFKVVRLTICANEPFVFDDKDRADAGL